MVDYIVATEVACKSLDNGQSAELRSKVLGVLNRHDRLKDSNVTYEEYKALRGLKNDKSIQILPADKGRTTVILDTEEYYAKCETLLNDKKTYKKLTRDPTQKYKSEFSKVLKDLVDEGIIEKPLQRQLSPTSDQAPRFYGLPKVHKPGTPVRPIVSSIGSISYPCAKYIAGILKPLVGKTSSFIKNSADFVDKIKDCRVEDDEELISFDVTALFTSVPVDKALVVIRDKLLNDDTLKERTSIPIDYLVKILELCLKCTYFVFRDEYYLQIHGAAMGSPVSPIVCNLYMEYFEELALSTAPHPPLWWFRFVDDTHSKNKKAHTQEFIKHLNSVDSDIQFTNEPETDGKLPFLDSLTVRQPDGSLKFMVFRKSTHTDQYLNFQSNHPVQHKESVVRTLYHRADKLVTDPELLVAEKNHIRTALHTCGYPDWIINRGSEVTPNLPTNQTSGNSSSSPKKPPVIIPYIRGISEQLRRIFGDYNVPVYFKPSNTLRQTLVKPKDPIAKDKVCGPVYDIQCNDCQDFYIGETERSMRARFLEHRRLSSTSSEVSQHIHSVCPGHSVSLEQSNILCVDLRWFERGVKEAVYIRAFSPTLNKDGGRYNLPSVWTNILRSRLTRCDHQVQ